MTNSIIENEWFHERLVINRNGAVKYYINSELIGEYSVGNLIEDADSFHISIDPYGWFTGHVQYFDNFYLNDSGNSWPPVPVAGSK